MQQTAKTCPFCGSHDTQKQADFGTSIMVAQHYCNDCRSVFEWIKWGESDSGLDLPGFMREGESNNNGN